MINKKVLITGGAGFIGSNLVNLLLEKGFNVTVIDNLSSGSMTNIDNKTITFINEDLININNVRFDHKFDIIFHLAASVGRQRSIDFPILDSRTNLIATVELLNFIVKTKVKKIVYSSSAAIYGELLTEIIDENHPLNPDSPYGVSKLAAEKMIHAYAELYNFDAVSLRYFNIFGINQRFDLYGNVIPIFVKNFNQKTPITIYGDGNQTRDFLNVKDVAYANYLSSITPNLNGYFNLGSGFSISINQLVLNLEHIYNYKIERIFLPKRKGDVLHCRANIQKFINQVTYSPSTNFKNDLREYIIWSQSQK
jgi:nucleoside-diphosphate-sugar epimerase